MAQHRKPKEPGSKPWMALGPFQYYFYLSPPPILFLSSLSPCVCLCTSSPCLPRGQSEESGEEMTGNRTMEGACQLPAIAWSLLPQLEHFRLYHKCADWWGRAQTCLLLFFCTNTVMERKERAREKRGLILCMSLKQTPEGNSYFYTVAAILRKTWIAFISHQNSSVTSFQRDG